MPRLLKADRDRITNALERAKAAKAQLAKADDMKARGFGDCDHIRADGKGSLSEAIALLEDVLTH